MASEPTPKQRYTIRVRTGSPLPVHKAEVFCDGERIPDNPFITGISGSISYEGAYAAGKRLAEAHREANRAPEPLRLDDA